MKYNIIDIEGVGEAYAEKLQAAGINTVDELLGRGASPRGRQKLAEETGISEKLILRWTNHADLFRVKASDRSLPNSLKLPELTPSKNSVIAKPKIWRLRWKKSTRAVN